MKTLLPTLAALAAPVLGLALAPDAQQRTPGQAPPQEQEDDKKGEEEAEAAPRGAVDIYGRPVNRKGSTFAESIRGGWKLTDMILPDSDPTGRVAQGFLHISEGFLSMEIHASWTRAGVKTENPERDLHTTFTAEYVLEGDRSIRCATRIGSYLDEETGVLHWEREGYERLYRVRMKDRELVLEFGVPGQAPGRLVFKPVVPSQGGAVDIYGRKRMNTGAFGDTDIYGRKKKIERGAETDIFGRRKSVNKPKGEGSDGDGR